MNETTHDRHDAQGMADPYDLQGPELSDVEPEPQEPPVPTTSTRTKILFVVVAVLVVGGGLIAVLSVLGGSRAPNAAPVTADASAIGRTNDRSISSAASDGASESGIPLPGVSVMVSAQAEDGAQTDQTTGHDLIGAPAPKAAPPDPNSEVARLKADLQARIQAFGQQVDALATRVRQFDGRLDHLDAGLKRLEDRVATSLSQQPTINADQVKQLQQTAAKLSALSAKLNAIDRRSRANTRRLIGEAGARWQGQRLPFEVESVDWWGASPSVAVRRGGRRDFFSLGATVAGWKLVSVDAASRTVRFERNGIQALARVAQ